MKALLDVTLDRTARDFRRSLDAIYYRIRELKREQPRRLLISARNDYGNKVRIVVIGALLGSNAARGLKQHAKQLATRQR